MPTLYFHYEFGQAQLKTLPKSEQKIINQDIRYYNMFNQGFDNLYYYIFNYKKWNYYRKFAIKAHKKHLDKFFNNLFNYIIDNNLQNNYATISMVYGFINHLTLDTIFHPYINYQVKNLKIPHAKIEFLIDFYINDYKNHTKWQNKTFKVLIPKLKFSKELLKQIDVVFKNTYQEDNISKIFNKSHNNCYFIYRYFITDIHGIKSNLYKIIDFFTPFNEVKFSETTFYNKGFTKELLNNENLEWHHPKDEKEIYTYSLEELYYLAFNTAKKLNKLAYEILHNNKDITEFLDLIKLLELKNIPELLLQ